MSLTSLEDEVGGSGQAGADNQKTDKVRLSIPRLKEARDAIRQWELGDQHPDWLLSRLIEFWGI